MNDIAEGFFALEIFKDMIDKRLAEGRPEEQAALTKMKDAFGRLLEPQLGPPFTLSSIKGVTRFEVSSGINARIYSGDGRDGSLSQYVEDAINEHGRPPRRLAVVQGTLGSEKAVLLVFVPEDKAS